MIHKSAFLAFFVICVPALVCNATVLPTDSNPFLVEVLPVRSDVVALYIQEGNVIGSKLVPYKKEAGDRLEEEERDGYTYRRSLYRNGEFIGYLGGKEGEEFIELRDYYWGSELEPELADYPLSYSFTTDSGKTFSPTQVSRKSKPNQFGRYQAKLGVLHTVFLHLPEPLTENESYRISFNALGLDSGSVRYTYNPSQQRSEAVHVNQVGFAPSDLVKRAYVSLWLGKNGSLEFGETIRYQLIDVVNGTIEFRGKANLFWPADKMEKLYRTTNYSEADVYRLDFSDFDRPGRYVVYAEGIGCSYPFDIRKNVWEDLSELSLRGFYHHRSGIELVEPYTSFLRPRPHHPEDGVLIYQSNATLLETTMGMMGGARDSFEALIEEATDKVLPDAWGGIMDAGDWDRRIQHLVITRLFLELYEMQPDFCQTQFLNIPESDNGIPDVVDEALWVLDLWVRLQKDSGAVGGGIESAAHPIRGDVSWTESIPIFAYGPDFWSTHQFVAASAKAAAIIHPFDSARSKVYHDAALRGMEWAEKSFNAELSKDNPLANSDGVRDARNLAAIELYRLTGNEKWHEIFKEHSVLKSRDSAIGTGSQRDAIWVYLNLPEGLGIEEWRNLSREVVLSDAEFGIRYSNNNAYSHLATTQGFHPFIGFLAGPQEAYLMLRAFHISGEKRFLEPVFASTQFGLGANPDNFVFITGIGSQQLQWVLHEDSIKTGRKAPPGIVVYGAFDHRADYIDEWPYFAMWVDMFGIDKRMEPGFYEWPINESYVDMWNFGSQNEYTPWQTMLKPAFVWTYLAALEAQKE